MASHFPFKKNTAVTIIFPILDADGDPVPDAAGLDSQYSIDGATFIACTNEAVNIANPGAATNTGLYSLVLVLGETNGDVVAIQVKTSTSGAKTTMMVFYTAAQTEDELNTAMAKDSTVAKDATVTKAVATGTLTASSLTLPADTGRLEVDHYWDGCLLMPTAGADAYQPRLIRSFANSGGVFTLDTPFTTLPTLVTYIILAFQKDALVAQELTLTGIKGTGFAVDTDSLKQLAHTTDLSNMALNSTVQKILASGTLTFSSKTVPADAGRLEVDHYWDGCLLVPMAGVCLGQPRLIRSFAGGVFTLDTAFTTLPGAVAYVILAFQKDALVAQAGEAASALTGYDSGKGVAKDDTVAKELTLSTLAGIFPLDPASESAVESAITSASSQGEAQTWSAKGEAQTWSSQGEAATALTAYAMGLGVAISGEAAAALAAWVLAYGPAKEATLTTMTDYILRILGLVQENTILDTTVFDVDGHLTSARLRTFTDATLTVVLATYTTTATYDVSGNMSNFQVVKT